MNLDAVDYVQGHFTHQNIQNQGLKISKGSVLPP
jgi:hypothetical protein